SLWRPPDLASQLVLVALLVLVLALLVFNLVYLTANFACREFGGVDVPISGIRQQRSHKSGEIAGVYVLCRGPDNVGAGDRTANGPACFGSDRPITKVCDEEHYDASGHVHFAEMDMRLRNRRAQTGKGQGEDEGPCWLVQVQRERALAVG